MKAFLLVVWISIVGMLQVKSQPVLAGEISLPSSLGFTNLFFGKSGICQEDSSSVTIVFRNIVYDSVSNQFDPQLYVAKISLVTNTLQWITKIDTIFLSNPHVPLPGWRGWTFAPVIKYHDGLMYVGATFERLVNGQTNRSFAVTRLNAQTGVIVDQRITVTAFGAIEGAGVILGGIEFYDDRYVTFHQEYYPSWLDTTSFRLTYFNKVNSGMIDQKIVPTIALPSSAEIPLNPPSLRKTPSGLACTIGIFQTVPSNSHIEYIVHVDSTGHNLQWRTPNPLNEGSHAVVSSASGALLGRLHLDSNQIKVCSHTGSLVSTIPLAVPQGVLMSLDLFEDQKSLGMSRIMSATSTTTALILFGSNGIPLWQCTVGDFYTGVTKRLLNGQYLVVTANADSLKLRLYNAAVSVNSIPRLHTKVYPNPTTGIVYIETEHNDVTCTVYDQTGKKVFHSLLFEKHIDLSHLPNGVYTYRVEHKESYGFGKLVLLH